MERRPTGPRSRLEREAAMLRATIARLSPLIASARNAAKRNGYDFRTFYDEAELAAAQRRLALYEAELVRRGARREVQS